MRRPLFVASDHFLFLLQLIDWALLPRAALGVLALLCGNGYIVGINQIYDEDIDKVNKPFLPIASGQQHISAATCGQQALHNLSTPYVVLSSNGIASKAGGRKCKALHPADHKACHCCPTIHSCSRNNACSSCFTDSAKNGMFAGELSKAQGWLLCAALAGGGLVIVATKFGSLITKLYSFGLFLGTIYSVPPLRLKRFAVAAFMIIATVRGFLLNFGVYHAVRAALGLPFVWSPVIT